MAIFWLVQEIGVRENWKCSIVETPEFLKPKESKGWGMMMSPGGDVDPRISEVTWLANVTREDMETWDVCHMSVSFEHVND
jgi:hypothetical protein